MFLNASSQNANPTNRSERGRGRGRGRRRGRGRAKWSSSVKSNSSFSGQSPSTTDNNNNIDESAMIKTKDKKEEPMKFDADEILMKIWFIINGFDQSLCNKMISKVGKTLRAFNKISLFELFEVTESVNWTEYNDPNIKKRFLDQIEEIRKGNLLISSPQPYGHRPRPPRGRGTGRPTRSMAPTQSISTRSRGSFRGRARGKGRGRGRGRGRGARPSAARNMTGSTQIKDNLGFAVGGANDINSFRDNIMKSDKIPKLSSITYEGIFYDYYFNTNENDAIDDVPIIQDNDNDDVKSEENDDKPLFYPSYCCAKSFIPDSLLMSESKKVTKRTIIKSDMIENDENDEVYDKYDFHIDTRHSLEYFMTVGLNSNIKQKDFERKKLNLVLVLDVSGSMSMGFLNGYLPKGLSKMKTANQCVLSVITNLSKDDRFGLVLFDHNVETKMELKKVKDHKIESFKDILNIEARGATNFELGYKQGLSLFNSNTSDTSEYENRIMFLTDACPNAGKTNPNSLMMMVKQAATNKDRDLQIFTTFVGIGLDFNTDLVNEITKVRGSNYFAVHSSVDFLKRVHQEFEYIVSPMVFNLKLTVQAEGMGDNSCIDAVYGSNEINIKSGEIMNINTLFPSPPDPDTGDIKGGIVLIKLKKSVVDNLSNVIIRCSFEDKFGQKYKNSQQIKLEYNNNNGDNNEYYANTGIQKGILLTRYVLLIKRWIKSVGEGRSLVVNDKYKQIFNHFIKYIENEMVYIKDNELKKEIKILRKLINLKC